MLLSSCVVTFEKGHGIFWFVSVPSPQVASSSQSLLSTSLPAGGTLEPHELQQALHIGGFQTDESSVRPFLRKTQVWKISLENASMAKMTLDISLSLFFFGLTLSICLSTLGLYMYIYVCMNEYFLPLFLRWRKAFASTYTFSTFVYLTDSTVFLQAANQFHITFTSFCVLCVQLANINEIFDKHDTNRTGRVTMDKSQFMKCMLSAMV